MQSNITEVKTLKDLRLNSGLTQKVVAQKLNITYQAYARYESGRRSVNVNFIIPLSNLFGIDIEQLVHIVTNQ